MTAFTNDIVQIVSHWTPVVGLREFVSGSEDLQTGNLMKL